MADMTEKEVNQHRGLLHEKKPKKFKSNTLAFNQSVVHTNIFPDQLDWRDYGKLTETDFADHFVALPPLYYESCF